MNLKRTAALATIAASAAIGCAVPSISGTAQATSPASHHLPATKVTTANLPTASQITADGLTATISHTGKGAGQSPLTLCQTKPWSAFSPNAEYTRLYDLNAKGYPKDVAYAGATIASFRTHAAAVKAADRMYATFACTTQARGVDGYIKGSAHTDYKTITLRTGQKLRLAYLSYATKYNADAVNVEQVAVVATGTHVELASLNCATQDNDPSGIIKTVRATLPTLAK